MAACTLLPLGSGSDGSRLELPEPVKGRTTWTEGGLERPASRLQAARVTGMAGTHCMRKTFANNVHKALGGDLLWYKIRPKRSPHPLFLTSSSLTVKPFIELCIKARRILSIAFEAWQKLLCTYARSWIIRANPKIH